MILGRPLRAAPRMGVMRAPARMSMGGVTDSDLIPAERLVDWHLAGVDGGIVVRTVLAETISTAGGNDSASNTTTIQNAIDAAPSGSVVLIPPGIYRTSALNMKSGVTLRGVGDFCKSTSSVAIGTGTKTFTVPAGLGYVAGVQVRVYRPGDRGYYMQGSVTTYSGTTLTLNIASSNGSGTYADWRITLTVLKTVSGGGSNGLINFGTSGVSSPTVGTNKVIDSGATAGSTSLVTTSAGPTVTVGQFLVISETNNAEVALWGASNSSPGATWADGWNTSGGRARGQIVEVTGVTGTTTQTLTIEPALYTDYPNTCWATPFSASMSYAGLEHMQLFADSADSHVALVMMRKAANCWVTGVDFDFATRDHIEIEWSYRCEVRNCHFYDRFATDSNYPGLIAVRYKSSLCRVENNIMERLQSSIMLEWGAAGNVVAFNYVFDGYNPSVRSFLMRGVDMNHGAHPQFNLAEGNIANKVCADSTWGTSSDSLIYRNAIFGFEQSRGPNNSRTVDATTYNETQVNYAIDLWEGQIRYSALGNVIGNTGNWASRTKVRKPTYPTDFDYDTTVLCIALGKDSDGLAHTPILTSPLATFIDHGNYDVVTAGQLWDGSISNQTLPNSYAYAAKPSWWDDNVTWPPINPASPGTLANATNPARYRYDNGISAAPSITYANEVQSVGDFEVQSDGTTISRAIAETVFKGLNAATWDTSAGNSSFSGVETSTLFIEADAAHDPDQSLIADGSSIARPGGFGMRVVQSDDANLILPFTHTSAPSVGFHFRWNGSQINSSPRDVAGWHNAQGFYEYLQVYDGSTPYFHTHYQGVGYVGGSGSNVNFAKSHWYWVEMSWVAGGATFSISFYDAESGYSLVGTSTNTMASGSMSLPTYFLIGCIKYSSGGSQTFDFDNIIYNADGSSLPRPTA
jgi:hypothetical protein